MIQLRCQTTGSLMLITLAALFAQGCRNEQSFTELPIQALVTPLTTPEDTLLRAALECPHTTYNAGIGLKFKILTQPLHGKLTLTNAVTGDISYMPLQDFNGDDGFRYSCELTLGAPRVSENLGLVRVTPVNDPPVADRGTFQMNALETLEMDLSSKVSDVDDATDRLRCGVDSAKLPQHGRLEVVDAAHCLLKYTPNENFRGTDLFGYQVLDPAQASGKGSIDVTVGNPLRHMRPALAVRASGCLMCHTSGLDPNVKNSNIITDFGYGSPWFWGMGAGGGEVGYNDFTRGINNGANPPPTPATQGIGLTANWGLAQVVNGSVTVPKDARIPASAIGSVSDAGWSNVVFSAKDYLVRQATNGATAAAPRFQVNESSNIMIGAPTAEQIRAGGSTWIAGNAVLKYVKQNNQAPELTGLRAIGTGTSLYYVADSSEPIVCAGDVVIDAPVWLNKTSVQSGDLGCRIYSTASIFVTGALPIRGLTPSVTTHNLQLASSRGIFMGMGRHDGYEDGPGRSNSATPCDQQDVDSLRLRLSDSRFGNRHRTAVNDAGWNDYKTAVFADEDKIPALTGACGVPGFAYKEIFFERLLLNAPYIGGRYDKPFKGSMIAEIISWLPGKFAFEFDPVFETVPILPIVDFNTVFSIGAIE